MYKKLFFPILLLISLNLSGCSASKEYYVDPSYSEEKVNASVLVLPVQGDWFDGSLNHTFGSVSGQAKTTFYNTLEPLLSNNLESSVEMVDSEQSFDDEIFEQSTLNTGKDSIHVLIPIEQSTFNSADNQPEIVLLLDQYYFLTEEKTTGNSTYAGHEEGITRTILYFETNYIYWSTEQKKAIAWGNTDSAVTLDKTDNITTSDYYDVLSQAVEKISEQGPLL